MNFFHYYKMNSKILIDKLNCVIFICSILVLSSQASAKSNDLSNGIWFTCEFAHSQIPPEDDCAMFDDDGFQIIDGIVYRIKINNSTETGCRNNRTGNCFLRNQPGLIAEQFEIGPIKLFENKIYLTRLGCTQEYAIIEHSNYKEIAPSSELCWWTPPKHYFISRYISKIRIILED
jgi:hypothetical protein